MKIIRIILVATLVWLMVLSTFTLLGFIPGVKDSDTQQAIIVGLFIIPFAYFGAHLFYKKGEKTNGFIIGLVMAIIALILDAFITVPFVIIPGNGSYYTFYTNPLLWVLVIENISVIYFYWNTKVKKPLS